jgi:dGTP triphosphohydrolase
VRGGVGVDAEVIEAACLAHDLGHPPFGHLGEEALNDLVLAQGDEDGFEGNAQSLRILSKLAVRFTAYDGLDLTRATLAACRKRTGVEHAGIDYGVFNRCPSFRRGVRQTIFLLAFRLLPTHSEFGESSQDCIGV